MDYSSAYKQPRITPVQGWDWQFANVSLNERAGEYGWNPNSEEVRRFSLRSPLENTREPPRQILLVEDNFGDVELVIEALEEHDVTCDVVVLSDGERAITFLDEVDAGRQSCPDLLILDLNLPRRHGTEVLARLRAGSTCQYVPVVVLTSSDLQKDKDSVTPLNPTRYLRKPLTLVEFLQLGGIFKEVLSGTL